MKTSMQINETIKDLEDFEKKNEGSIRWKTHSKAAGIVHPFENSRNTYAAARSTNDLFCSRLSALNKGTHSTSSIPKAHIDQIKAKHTMIVKASNAYGGKDYSEPQSFHNIYQKDKFLTQGQSPPGHRLTNGYQQAKMDADSSLAYTQTVQTDHAKESLEASDRSVLSLLRDQSGLLTKNSALLNSALLIQDRLLLADLEDSPPRPKQDICKNLDSIWLHEQQEQRKRANLGNYINLYTRLQVAKKGRLSPLLADDAKQPLMMNSMIDADIQAEPSSPSMDHSNSMAMAPLRQLYSSSSIEGGSVSQLNDSTLLYQESKQHLLPKPTRQTVEHAM